MFEPLEERIVLNAAPILQGLPEVLYLTPGTSYHLALDGKDADNDKLTYTIQSTNNDGNALFSASVLEGNKSVKFSVYQEKTAGKADWELVGDMIMELFQKEAPLSTQRFMDIINGVEIGGKTYTYNGVAVHRILDGFMFQGGDVKYGNGYGGTGVTFPDEYNSLLQHSSRGIVSTANSNNAEKNIYNSNDSQFFITDNATPWLDGKHNVFGFITEGDDIREKINAVAASTAGVPVNAVKTDNFQIFDDYENGTLRFVVPSNAKDGESQVTVMVSDGVNDPVPYTFTVKVMAEPTSKPAWNVPKFLDLSSGQSYTFTLPEYAVPGEVEYVAQYNSTAKGDPNITVTRSGRDVTITTPATGGGMSEILIKAVAKDGDVNNGYTFGNASQIVTLFVAPSAPKIKLSPLADTGTQGDNITSRNNDKEGNELIFEVSDVVDGASVLLYSNGYEMAGTLVSQVQQENGLWTMTIKAKLSENPTALADGTYQFSAKQRFTKATDYGHEAMESPISTQLAVVIDTKGPVFTKPAGNTIFDAKVGKELKIEFETQNQAADATKFTIHSVKNSKGETIEIPAGAAITENGIFTWTPTAGQADDYIFEIKATNGSGLSSTKSVEISFQNGPQYKITGTTTIDEGEEFVLELELDDEDYEGAVEFTLKEGSLPTGTNYTLEKTSDTTAVFRWTTTEADGPAVYNPVFILTDKNGDTRRKDVLLTVNEIDTAPEFTNEFKTVYTLREEEEFTLQLTAKDDDIYPGASNPLTYSFVGTHPDGMTIDAATGLIKWTPDESCGTFSFDVKVRVTDKTGLFDEKSLHLFVEEVDSPPVFEDDDTVFVGRPGSRLTGQVTARDPDYIQNPDIPINQVVYMLEGDDIPDGMTIDPQTGQITWNIPSDFLGQDVSRILTIGVTAQEITSSGQLGLSSTKSVMISISAKIIWDDPTGGPTDPNEAIMQKLFGELGASGNSLMLQGDYGSMLTGRQLFQYSPVIDYGHTSYHGLGSMFHPGGFGIDGSNGGDTSLESKPEAENTEEAVNTEGKPNTPTPKKSAAKQGESSEQRKNAAILPWDVENLMEDGDSLAGYEWIRQVAWNLTQSTEDYDPELIVEETPEMEDAIALLAAAY